MTSTYLRIFSILTLWLGFFCIYGYTEELSIPLVQNYISEDSLYADILNHSKKPVTKYDRAVNAHETTHMIHGEHSLIGSYESFYLGNGVIYRMDYISFPKLVISQYIPQNLRGRRYRLYVEQMPDWKNDPLYLMNEWSAYINDAEVSIEDYSRGITPANRTDATMGPLEFSVYCTALGMEIKRRDKEVWKQYKPLLIKQLRRSKSIYDRASQIDKLHFKEDDKYYSDFVENELFKSFLVDECEGVFSKSFILE